MRWPGFSMLLVTLVGIFLSGCREEAVAYAEARSPTSPPPAIPSPAAAPAPAERARESLSLIPEFPRAHGGPFPFGAQDIAMWRARIPQIAEVEIPSSLDGAKQRALFYDPQRP